MRPFFEQPSKKILVLQETSSPQIALPRSQTETLDLDIQWAYLVQILHQATSQKRKRVRSIWKLFSPHFKPLISEIFINYLVSPFLLQQILVILKR